MILGYIFTFQYGSTYISTTIVSNAPIISFTFQYGSTYIYFLNTNIDRRKHFTFQYGSTYMYSVEKLGDLYMTLHSSMVLLILKEN